MVAERKDIFMRGMLILLAVSVLCVMGYYYFDRLAALWFYQHHYIPDEILNTVSLIPNVFEIVAIGIYIAYFASWLLSMELNFLNKFTGLANCIVITHLFTEWTKFVFGRYWPMTWIGNNPSYIHTKHYGFHFFTSGHAYKSFPSGHTSITVAAVTMLALMYPRFRIPALVIAAAVPISLVLLSHHFVSDTIAGGGLGCLVAYWYFAAVEPDDLEMQLLLD